MGQSDKSRDFLSGARGGKPVVVSGSKNLLARNAGRSMTALEIRAIMKLTASTAAARTTMPPKFMVAAEWPSSFQPVSNASMTMQ